MSATYDAETFTPAPLTIERSTVDPDRYRLAYSTPDGAAKVSDLIRWHDAVASIEAQCPSLRSAGRAPHPAIVEMLADVRHAETTGIASLTIAGETR